jgi:protein-arginine kinase
MTEAEEQALREAKVLFEAPDSVLVLSSGLGRDWPEARAIFVTGNCATTGVMRDTDVAAWINQEEHLQLRCQRKDANVKAAFGRVLELERELQGILERTHGQQPAFAAPDSSFGHLSASPENVGTGLRVEVFARLPKLGAERGFRALCKKLQLQGKRAAEEGADAWVLSNIARIGISEVEQLNTIIKGAKVLVTIEQRLERGDGGDFEAVTKAVLDELSAS